ncbi:MAG: hypothetical protein Q4F67_09420, partial [Propionibacteriaceae bacterium]|nr:hypothetical protein [Propionibacteriaceae bacterium]
MSEGAGGDFEAELQARIEAQLAPKAAEADQAETTEDPRAGESRPARKRSARKPAPEDEATPQRARRTRRKPA